TLGKTTLSNSGDVFSMFVAGYDSTGKVLFARGAGTPGQVSGYSVAVDSGGNLIVAGQLTDMAQVGHDSLLSQGSSDAFVAKLFISWDGGNTLGFTSYNRLPNGSFQLDFNLCGCSTWRLQTSSDLKSWSDLQSYGAQSGIKTFIDQDAKYYPRRFYRLVSP
ncbi:MAG: hypothetical protein ABI600_10835, partial [Luteolibacter sp.]